MERGGKTKIRRISETRRKKNGRQGEGRRLVKGRRGEAEGEGKGENFLPKP